MAKVCLSQISQKEKKRMTKKEEQELKILEFMKDKDYVPMKAKEIAMIMRVPKKEYGDFLEVLGNLELNFKIQKNRKSK